MSESYPIKDFDGYIDELDPSFFYEHPVLLEDPELTREFLDVQGEEVLEAFMTSELARKGLQWALDNLEDGGYDEYSLGESLRRREDGGYTQTRETREADKALAEEYLKDYYYIPSDMHGFLVIFSKKP